MARRFCVAGPVVRLARGSWVSRLPAAFHRKERPPQLQPECFCALLVHGRAHRADQRGQSLQKLGYVDALALSSGARRDRLQNFGHVESAPCVSPS